jgi:7,8-dihydroneopterin aldolase/epimerase/oxygenase
VHDEEERLGQRFYVDAELTVIPDGPLDSDSIETTVDYGVAFSEIEAIITGKRRFLIEALAMDVAKALCARFPQIQTARITVRKPNAPVAGVLDHVEVTVVWPEAR